MNTMLENFKSLMICFSEIIIDVNDYITENGDCLINWKFFFQEFDLQGE